MRKDTQKQQNVQVMRLASLAYVLFMLCTFLACGRQTLHGNHYDTTMVDTMIVIEPNANHTQGNQISQWIYNTDSTLATIESLTNRHSQITVQNTMEILVKQRNATSATTMLVLHDGEKFAGNSFDTTNIVKIYSDGNMVGKYSYQPGPSKSLDTAIVADKAFLYNLRASKTIKIEVETFTSGNLVYDFKSTDPLLWEKGK